MRKGGRWRRRRRGGREGGEGEASAFRVDDLLVIFGSALAIHVLRRQTYQKKRMRTVEEEEKEEGRGRKRKEGGREVKKE